MIFVKIFSRQSRIYEYLGWRNYLKADQLWLLNCLWELEQEHTPEELLGIKDLDVFAYTFYISDKELAEVAGIPVGTLRRKIPELAGTGLINVSSRTENYLGKATSYTIVKPIPLPKEIKPSKHLIDRRSEYYIEKIINEHIQLLQECGKIEEGYKYSVNNGLLVELTEQTTPQKVPQKPIQAPVEQPDVDTSLNKRAVVMADKFVKMNIVLRRKITSLPAEQAEALIYILDVSNGYVPDSPISWINKIINNLDNDEKLLNMIAAAENAKVLKEKGFTKHDNSKGKGKTAKRKASDATSREYYADMFA